MLFRSGSALMRDALGQHISERFLAAKRDELKQYETTVHDWELKRYLSVF